MPNQLECPLSSRRRNSPTSSGEPFRDRSGVCPTPKSAEPVLGPGRPDGVPIEIALAKRLHRSPGEPLTLSMPCSTISWEKTAQGTPDNSSNMTELVLFVRRFVPRAHHHLLSHQLAEQLVLGRPRCKLAPELGRDLPNPLVVSDDLCPLVPSEVVLLDRRLGFFVSRVVAQSYVSLVHFWTSAGPLPEWNRLLVSPQIPP